MAMAQKPKKKSKVNPANTEMEELVPSSSDLNELFETSNGTTGKENKFIRIFPNVKCQVFHKIYFNFFC